MWRSEILICFDAGVSAAGGLRLEMCGFGRWLVVGGRW